MGLFDTVCFVCPKCGGRIEEQSKAGECALAEYHSENVPDYIAKDIEGTTVSCESCDKRWQIIRVPVVVESVPMALIASD